MFFFMDVRDTTREKFGSGRERTDDERFERGELFDSFSTFPYSVLFRRFAFRLESRAGFVRSVFASILS